MYFTEERVEVTSRIKKGLTTLIQGTGSKQRHQAEVLAKQKGSYYYDVYEKNNRTLKRHHIGFAVPK